MEHSLHATLQRSGLRYTQVRKSVFATLQHATHPMSTTSIIDTLPAIDKVSVYRTIELFLKLDIITAVPYGWKAHYELASPFKPHHHHFQCTHCLELMDIHAAELEKLVTKLANNYQFTVSTHTFELNGVCKQCRSTRAKA